MPVENVTSKVARSGVIIIRLHTPARCDGVGTAKYQKWVPV